MTTRPITRPYEEVKWRLGVLKEQLENGCLDPELYDILVALNNNGYFTASSCAGHTRGSTSRGSISFAGPRIFKGWQEEILLWLLQSHELKDIKLEVGKNGYTTARFASIGSQYGNNLYDNPSEEDDYYSHVPPRPEKCETCGKSDFWLQGDPYDYKDTLEWMCKQCQPLLFNSDRACLTPEIAKRREELPKLKLWEVEDWETGKTFPMRAKNEHNIYKRLAAPADVFIKRVK